MADIKLLQKLDTAQARQSGSLGTFASMCVCLSLYNTCWLFRWRWSDETYVAVKINVSNYHTRKNATESELNILRHISECSHRHKGWHFIRKLLDSFTLETVSGRHVCLVFEPLRESLLLYRERFIGNVIPSDILKIMLQMILHGLNYLHSECHVIHTGMNSSSYRDVQQTLFN